MISSNYFSDNDDLNLQIDQMIDWQETVGIYENDFEDAKKYKESGDEKLANAPSSLQEAVDSYKIIFESIGEIMGKTVAPKAKEMEAVGLKFDKGKVTFPPSMVECYNVFRDAGLQPYSISRKYGGLGLPAVTQAVAMEILARGDAAFAIAIGSVNLADTIERFGSAEMKQTWVPKMASGELVGAMALTEPNYGSDLPGVQTKAEQTPDGKWKLNGTKRFITLACGFNGAPAVILTLARTGNPTSGARGLSFFLVHGDDVQIAGIEKKLGLHCSPTCEVVYENTPALLIGQEGQGLIKYAMGMMNSARLSIAAQSMGIATAAYFEAKKYASERIQFGKPIDQIPAVRRMLDRMEREVTGMRCLTLEAARTVDMYVWRTERLEHSGLGEKEVRKDEHVRKWEKLASLFTPVSKYYTSEMCNVLASDAVQIYGGAGYTEDYDVARIFRDARITNIYEGTTQLQIVGAIGTVTAGMAANGHLRTYINDETQKFSQSAELKKVFAGFEEIVTVYKDLKNAGLKDTLAFEVVESAARYLVGMLMERSTAKLSGEAKQKRMNLCQAYHIDSQAILSGNILKLKLSDAKTAVPA